MTRYSGGDWKEMIWFCSRCGLEDEGNTKFTISNGDMLCRICKTPRHQRKERKGNEMKWKKDTEEKEQEVDMQMNDKIILVLIASSVITWLMKIQKSMKWTSCAREWDV